MEGTQAHYDAIIIGSGIGGMTVAALLAKLAGKRVLVLEQHSKAGELTHSFKRPGGFEWDEGGHYVGGVGIGRTHRKLMDFLSDGALDWQPLPGPFDIFSYPGFRLDVPFGQARYIGALEAQFAGQGAALQRYFEDVHSAAGWLRQQVVRKALPPWLASLAGLISERGEVLATTTTTAYLEQHFDDKLLRAVLASQWPHYGLPPGESAFAQHALVVEAYLDGAYYPVGGSAAIGAAIGDCIWQAGGELSLGREATELIIENGQVSGVRARLSARGETPLKRYHAPVVISAIGAVATYLNLVPPSVGPLFRDAIRAFRHGHSAVTLFLGLRCTPLQIGVQGANYWLYSGLDHDAMRDGAEHLLEGRPEFAFVSFASAKDPDARRHTAQIVALVDYEAFERWESARPPGGAWDYQAVKRRIAEGLLSFVERRLPGLRDLVAYQELSMPSTFEHFTAHPLGAFYGVPAAPQRYSQEWLDIETPIRGLYLTGEDVGSLGVSGASMGGLATAGKVLGSSGLATVMKALG